MGTQQSQLPQKGHSPLFSAHVSCGQKAGWITIPLGMEVGLGRRRLCIRWGHGTQLPPPPEKSRGHSPQFSVHVRCDQMAGWTKMPLGVEVGLGPDDFVLDGDPAPPKGAYGTPRTIFGPCLLWSNGWMHQDITWYGGRPRPRRHCC